MSRHVEYHGKGRSLVALDALNVFMADVRDGLGPFLAIYLAAAQHWDAGRIGIAMSVQGFATVAAQTPAGGLIDRIHAKRAAVALAALAVALGVVAMAWWPTLPAIIAAQAVIGASSAIFAPAVSAISLGLVGHGRLPRRMGRNEAFNHAGNVTAALLAGWVGDHVAKVGVFYLVAAMSAATVATTLLIRRGDIDYALARGAVPDGGNGASFRIASIGALLRDRRIAAFILAVSLFHFANAAMLPLVGQKLTDGKTRGVASDMAACIIAAQVVMVPVALASSRLIESWGRKPVFLIGFAVLPIRGLLYTLGTHPYFLVAVQLLDGIGAGIFGVVGVLVIADLTKGTGRFNLMQGVLATAVGIGASLSNLMTGFVVRARGFDAGFFALSAIAALALLFSWWAVPETGGVSRREPSACRPEEPGMARGLAREIISAP
ncbi:MAG: MFS transporter [Singulisphaera sp.]|nr:MFS transporter [Singulisphaera sp.]